MASGSSERNGRLGEPEWTRGAGADGLPAGQWDSFLSISNGDSRRGYRTAYSYRPAVTPVLKNRFAPGSALPNAVRLRQGSFLVSGMIPGDPVPLFRHRSHSLKNYESGW